MNYIRDCRNQNDIEALGFRTSDEIVNKFKEDYHILITSKVPDTVRAGAADLLSAAKDDLGHIKSPITTQNSDQSLIKVSQSANKPTEDGLNKADESDPN
ncbi:hypothetical protein BGZ76_006184, partial [Entomortierella beljakovae]